MACIHVSVIGGWFGKGIVHNNKSYAALSPVSTGIGDYVKRVYTIPVIIQATHARSAWP